MKIVPLIVTYNELASGPFSLRCAEYLMAEGTNSFGTAIEQIDIYPRCQTGEPIIPGLEFMSRRFQVGLTKLPYIRFKREARLFEVSYASSWVYSDTKLGSSITELP